jgi:hypothetical protein
MDHVVGSPFWLVTIMGLWVVACLGIGCRVIFFDAERPDQFEE